MSFAEIQVGVEMAKISELSLENFQGISSKQTVQLGNFSLIFGENSAGKSSIARALLLLCQSINGSSPTKNESAKRFLNFSGSLIDLAGFRNVVHKHDDNLQVTLGLKIEVTENDFGLTPTGSLISRDRKGATEAVNFNSLSFEVRESKNGLESLAITFDFMFQDIQQSLTLIFETRDKSSLVLSNAYETSSMATRSLLGLRADSDVSASDFQAVNYSWKGSWPGIVMPRPSSSSQDGFLDSSLVALSRLLFTSKIFISRFLSKPSHIPSLREIEPRVTLRSTAPSKPSRFRRNENLKQAATSNYLHQLTGGRYEIEQTTHEMGESGFLGEVEVKFLRDKRLGVAVSFQDVGVGLSQVLPLLLEIDTQDREPGASFIIVEQPELHLHPRMQAELAELMYTKAQESSQIIAETHSESMLLRVQRLLRKRKDEAPIQDSVSVIYATFDAEAGTKFHNLELRQDMDFLVDFPQSFSDLRLGELE